MGELVLTECPIGVGRFDEQCYIRPEDYDTFFGRPKMGANACPASMGEENCVKILTAKEKEDEGMFGGWKEGKFSSGLTGLGIGYYGSDLIVDGEKQRRYHGLGANISLSASPFIWGLANLTLSMDGNLGFGGGIEANGGVGPTFSIGLPALVRGWGSLKARGILASGGEGDGQAGWGLNPEAGLSVLFVDIRWIFPSVVPGGADQGHSLFAGVSVGLP